FVFDMCGIEVDPVSYQVRVDRYVSMHDAGRLLNPLIAEGQMRGAFVQGIATALYEEFVYDENGQFVTGTFADYLVPTAAEIPRVEMLHQETPSPLTPLGAKGLAGGQTRIAMLNLRLLEPAVLIDITRIGELDAIREADGKIEVGAAVTQNKLMAWPALAEKLPLVAAALPYVGHFQTRNKGTV